MSTVADYRGRKVDLSAFEGYDSYKQTKLKQQLFGEGYSGSATAGVVKLSQAFIVEFCSDNTGRLYYDENVERGTSFLSEVRAGRVFSEVDVYSLFHLSAGRVENYFKSLETDDDPADERWGKVELTNVTIADGRVTLGISITSLAGTEHTFLLPIPVTP